MITLVVVNQKGGVGKTTTAVTLAHGAALRGVRTLLVDLDAQGNCSDALGLEKRSGLYDFLINNVGRRAVAVARQGLDIIQSDKATVKAQRVIVGEPFSEQVLRRCLDGIAGDYDLAILDCAPSAGILQLNAMVAATHFLLPVKLDPLAVVGARDLLGTAASLQKVGGFSGTFLGVLPTIWDRRTNESDRQLREMSGTFGRFVWPPIPEDVKAREAPGHGRSLWEYAPGTRSLVGVAIKGQHRGGYAAVLERLLREVKL